MLVNVVNLLGELYVLQGLVPSRYPLESLGGSRGGALGVSPSPLPPRLEASLTHF